MRLFVLVFGPLFIYMIFCIGVFLNLNGAWSWLIRYHVAVYTDTGLERLDY